MLQEGKLRPQAVISHILPLKEAAKGYEIFNAKREHPSISACERSVPLALCCRRQPCRCNGMCTGSLQRRAADLCHAMYVAGDTDKCVKVRRPHVHCSRWSDGGRLTLLAPEIACLRIPGYTSSAQAHATNVLVTTPTLSICPADVLPRPDMRDAMSVVTTGGAEA
jgi:hypothetical protein